jgi:hypothetical protein
MRTGREETRDATATWGTKAPPPMRGRRLALLTLTALLVAVLAVWPAGCSRSNNTPDSASSSTDSTAAPSGDIDATVGEAIHVGNAIVTVRALQPTFNPVSPEQRLSEQPPAAPAGSESFYQAYVKVENDGVTPLRVDADDFVCAVGNSVVGIEPTWSGPAARSLLKNSSLELLVTFKAKAGYEPVLLYSPSWYDGTIRVHSASSETTQTT